MKIYGYVLNQKNEPLSDCFVVYHTNPEVDNIEGGYTTITDGKGYYEITVEKLEGCVVVSAHLGIEKGYALVNQEFHNVVCITNDIYILKKYIDEKNVEIEKKFSMIMNMLIQIIMRK